MFCCLINLFYIVLSLLTDLLIRNLILIIIIYLVVVLAKKFIRKDTVSSNGRAVLITGCDTGFGNRLAHRLNQIGFNVFATVLSVESTGAQQLVKNAVQKKSNQLSVLEMDVTNDRQVNTVYEKVKQDLENRGLVLWAVVNNAGINSSAPLDWGTLENYRRLFEVNVFGTVRVTRVFLPLIKQSKGRIINVVSILGRISGKLGGIYCMSKHCLVAFTDTLRREMLKFNVRVLSIEPTYFATNLTNNHNLEKQLKQNWEQSSDEVQMSYGNYESERQLLLNLDKVLPTNTNIDIVVNDMIDSIVNCRPKTTYRPTAGFIDSMFFLLAIFSPNYLTDCLMDLQEYILSIRLRLFKN